MIASLVGDVLKNCCPTCLFEIFFYFGHDVLVGILCVRQVGSKLGKYHAHPVYPEDIVWVRLLVLQPALLPQEESILRFKPLQRLFLTVDHMQQPIINRRVALVDHRETFFVVL